MVSHTHGPRTAIPKIELWKALFHQVMDSIRDQTSCPKRWVGHWLNLWNPQKRVTSRLAKQAVFEGFFFFKITQKRGVTPRFRSGPLPHQSGREISSPAFRRECLRYGTLKLKGLECEILSYVEWMDRLGGDGGGGPLKLTAVSPLKMDGWNTLQGINISPW